MPLTMRPTGLSSGVDKDRQDWTIFDDGEPVGRIYEVPNVGDPDLVDLRLDTRGRLHRD
jgi:hypothetical protein